MLLLCDGASSCLSALASVCLLDPERAADGLVGCGCFLSAQISALSQSFTALGDVDLLDADTEINPLVPAVFVGVTLAFVGVMVGSKCRNKKAVTKQARAVYLQEGELTRPSVIRGTEFENILRGRFRLSGVAWLIFLDLITANNLIAMAFWWAHDHTVFTTADKAFLLYASVLSTFLACAFFFQTNVDSEMLSDGTCNNNNQNQDCFSLLCVATGGIMVSSAVQLDIFYFLLFIFCPASLAAQSTRRQSAFWTHSLAPRSRICFCSPWSTWCRS